MSEDATSRSTVRALQVVVWNGADDAVLDEPEPLAVDVDFANEKAIPSLVATVESVTRTPVALRWLTDTHAHVEVLETEPMPHHTWRARASTVPATLPWYRPGWYSRTCDLLDGVLAKHGMTRTARPAQQKHWSISALASVPTTDGDVWFKQVPPFMAHEGRLTEWLAARLPGAVPDIVATGDDWSLARAFPPAIDHAVHKSPYRLLAELQLDASGHVDDLIALGCPDRTLPRMSEELAALVERDDAVEADLRERLLGALPEIQSLIGDLENAGVGPSIVHGDLHAGNWLRREDGSWLIFDWTDGCVAHPFMDLGVMLNAKDDLRRARVDEYTTPWRDAVGDTTVQRCLTLASSIAFGYHAVSYLRIVDNLEGADAEWWRPVISSYLRRLLDAER